MSDTTEETLPASDEYREWGQQARVSVLTRDPDGTVRRSYRGDPYFGSGVYRGIDLLSPVWNALDLLPGGRGDWEPSEGH